MIFEFDSFLFDEASNTLTHDGVQINLSSKSVLLLRLLLHGRSRIVSKEEIIGELWPGVEVYEGNVTQQIWLLRRAIKKPKLILAAPGQGYRLAAVISIVGDEETDDGTNYEGGASDIQTMLERSTEGELRHARSRLEESLKRSPSLAVEQALLSVAWLELVLLGSIRVSDGLSKARAFAGAALLDHRAPPAALAVVALADFLDDHDVPRASERLREALNSEKSSAIVPGMFARFCMQVGEFETADRVLADALQTRPAALHLQTLRARVQFELDRRDLGLEMLRHLLAAEPALEFARESLAVVLLQSEDPDESLREVTQLLGDCRSARHLALMGYAAGRSGKDRPVRAALKALYHMSKRTYVSAYHFATVYAGAKLYDQCAAELARAKRERSPLLLGLRLDHFFDSWCEDQVIRRIGKHGQRSRNSVV